MEINLKFKPTFPEGYQYFSDGRECVAGTSYRLEKIKDFFSKERKNIEIKIELEPKNEHDKNAIAIYLSSGNTNVHVGYVNAETAQKVALRQPEDLCIFLHQIYVNDELASIEYALKYKPAKKIAKQVKINCPACNQEYEVDKKIIGQKAECEICKEKFVVKENNLIDCFDCNHKVSKHAKACPNCGCPISSQDKLDDGIRRPITEVLLERLEDKNDDNDDDNDDDIRQPVTQKFEKSLQPKYQVAHRQSNFKSNLISVLICTFSLFVILGSCASQQKQNYDNSAIFVIVIALIVFIIFAAKAMEQKIKCLNCGYVGKPKIDKQPSGCVAILLLCIGIIPGLIYILLAKTTYICPHCGVKVIK